MQRVCACVCVYAVNPCVVVCVYVCLNESFTFPVPFKTIHLESQPEFGNKKHHRCQ